MKNSQGHCYKNRTAPRVALWRASQPRSTKGTATYSRLYYMWAQPVNTEAAYLPAIGRSVTAGGNNS